MWTSIDSATQRANSTGNHGTAHGFGLIAATDSLTIATATTDTIAATIANTTPDIFPETVAVA